MGERVVIVTGGSSGIGEAIAREMARRGWRVVVNYSKSAAQAAAVAKACSGAGGEGIAIRANVAEDADCRALVQAAIDKWGRLDALVNNAGITGAASGPLEELTLVEWNRRIGSNLTGVFLTAKHCAAQLRATRGAIVNVASTRALQSEPHTEAYSASKGGVVALTHALAMSLGPEVRVNCVSPGWIDVRAWRKGARRDVAPLSAADHAQHPVGRVGRPEDVAAMIAWLLSDEAGFVTGQNFVVDGGMTRKMIYVE